MSVRLPRFIECSGLLSTIQFAYWKDLGICDALLCVSIHSKMHLREGRRLRSYRMISAQPLIRQGVLYKFCFACIDGSVLSICQGTDNVSMLSVHTKNSGARDLTFHTNQLK